MRMRGRNRTAMAVVSAVIALLSPNVSSAYPAPKVPRTVTVCDLAKNPSRYHGELVRVRATTRVLDEWTELRAGGCRIGFTVPHGASDQSVKQYVALVDAKPHPPEPCQDCRRYSVTATLVGVVESAEPTGRNPGKPGFGHMGIIKVRLSIRSVADIVASPAERERPGENTKAVSVSFCGLLQNPQVFDGKVIRIRAIYRYGFEISSLESPECCPTARKKTALEFGELDSRSKKELRKAKRDMGLALGVFVGRFSADGPFGHMGLPYHIAISRVETIERSVGFSGQKPPGWISQNCEEPR